MGILSFILVCLLVMPLFRSCLDSNIDEVSGSYSHSTLSSVMCHAQEFYCRCSHLGWSGNHSVISSFRPIVVFFMDLCCIEKFPWKVLGATLKSGYIYKFWNADENYTCFSK